MTTQSLLSASSSLQSHYPNRKLLRMGEAVSLFGLSHSTLRKLDRDGKILVFRTPGNTRLISISSLKACLGIQEDVTNEKKVIAYCRVSTSKQANDLLRQIEKVKTFCLERFETEPLIFSEIGSGLSDLRRKYLTLIEKVVEGSVSTVVCFSKDRLSRFGINAFQFLCEKMGVELVFIENVTTEKSYEQELAEDILSILHVYSCRHYGKRGSDALRKHVSDEARERITELKKEGYSVLGITRILHQENFKYENYDSPISRHIVRKLVYEIAKEESLKKATGLATGIKAKSPSDQKSLVDHFIEEKCDLRNSARVFSRELFESFDGWARATGKKGLTRREFGNQLIVSGFKRGKGKKGRRCWFGLMLKQNSEDSDRFTRTK